MWEEVDDVVIVTTTALARSNTYTRVPTTAVTRIALHCRGVSVPYWINFVMAFHVRAQRRTGGSKCKVRVDLFVVGFLTRSQQAILLLLLLLLNLIQRPSRNIDARIAVVLSREFVMRVRTPVPPVSTLTFRSFASRIQTCGG